MHYNGVGWVDKPNVSDGLSACWVFNPTYPLCHFFMHSTIVVLSQASALLYQFKKITLQNKSSSIAPTAQVGFLNPTFGHRPKRCAWLVLRTSVGFKNPTYGLPVCILFFRMGIRRPRNHQLCFLFVLIVFFVCAHMIRPSETSLSDGLIIDDAIISRWCGCSPRRP